MWPPHTQKVKHILWNCQGHWCNTKAGTPLGSLLLLWILTRHISHLWNWPRQFPLFFQDDTMSISNSGFCLSNPPSHRASTYWLSQPQESSMQTLPEWDWFCFSDQTVVRLENFFPKSIQGNVMVKSNVVWINFIKEFIPFFFFLFIFKKVTCFFAHGYRESYLISSGKCLGVAWCSGGSRQELSQGKL